MRRRLACLAPFALALVLAGCDVPANLLSSEERNSIYSIEMTQSGRSLAAGDSLSAGSEVDLTIATLSGMKKPDSLSLDLVDSSGTKIASLVFTSPSSSRALDPNASVVPITSVVGSLPGFRLPNQLAPGYYALKSSIYVGNSAPQQSEFDFFVPSSSYEFGGVTFSPSVPRAGSGVLLTAMLVAVNPQTSATPTIVAASATPSISTSAASTTGTASAATTSTLSQPSAAPGVAATSGADYQSGTSPVLPSTSSADQTSTATAIPNAATVVTPSASTEPSASSTQSSSTDEVAGTISSGRDIGGVTTGSSATIPATTSSTAATTTTTTATTAISASTTTTTSATDTIVSAGQASTGVSVSMNTTGATQAPNVDTSSIASASRDQASATANAWDRLWFRWTQGSQVLAEGSASAGFDKIVWKVPDREGAYSVRVDFYPGPPPNGSYSIPSPWHQSISFIAKPSPPEKFKDPFSIPSRFHSLFTFDGAIADSATGASEKAPVLTGNPSLVATAQGYGERFDTIDGFIAKGLGFDPTGHAGKFSILMRLSIESFSGTLLSLEVEGGGSLAVGLDQGSLWLEYQGGGLPQRFYPGISPGRDLHDLMLSFSPDKDGVSVVWSIDASSRKQTLIPNCELRYDRLIVGGASSATAVWDALGLCYDDVGGPPSFLAASLFRTDGERLLAANGFESSSGDGLVTSGKVKFRPFSATLASGASLGIRDELPTGSGLVMSFGLRSGAFNLVLARSDGSLFLTIGSDGSIRDGTGLLRASLREEPRRFSLSLSKVDKGIEISGVDGPAEVIDLQLPARITASIVGSAAANLESFWIASNSDT